MSSGRDLPTGTLTFLFTDIEGSTQLLNEIGDDFRRVIEEHHQILREAIAAHGGLQARLEGDSFFVVFTSAPRAVAAAVDAQKALSKHSWSTPRAVRVRMGLHTGEAALGGGDYVGLDVHRAARIMSAAHGGQVLVSETTSALIAHNLPVGVTLRNVGEFRLKDLGHPEHLYQLVIDAVPSEFPPPRALDSTPNNLPTQLTSFIGRGNEVAEGARLLADARLLTLTGPGGTGKTRLSLRLAAEVAHEFTDGVYFVPLAPVADPAMLPSAITQVLGVPETGGRSPREQLIDHLRDKDLLLVLDNFEQILSAAPYVGELLQAAPRLKTIVTSRAPLRIYGEREFNVPPLGLPDPQALPADLHTLSQYEAVKLFIERAMSVKPDFQVTNANAPAIAQICVRLDGLPLAIELAAARIKLLPPEAMLRRLEHRLGFLGVGPRDAPARQQTLRGAIAWSFDMLEESARRLFARFGVFVGGADLEQAETVCGPAEEVGGDVLDTLAALVDHSLLVQHETAAEPRVSMLETIREFALERLADSGEADKIQRRHAETYLELAERAAPQLTGHNQKLWLDTLEREHDNIRAAHDFLIGQNMAELSMRLIWAMWRFWQMRLHVHEARQRIGATLSLTHSNDHPEGLVRAYEAAGSIEYWAGDMNAAAQYYEESLRLSRELDDEALVANALYNLSFPYGLSKDTRARALLEEALAHYRRLGDAPGIGKVLWGRGNANLFKNEFSAALRDFEEALAIFRDQGDRFHIAWSLHEIGMTSVRLADLSRARAALHEGLEMFSASGDLSGVILLLDDLAELAEAEGDPLAAARLAGAAGALQSSTGANLSEVSNMLMGRRVRGHGLSPDTATAWNEGQSMTPEQAVAYALGRSESVGPATG